jgi:hypothetical protein
MGTGTNTQDTQKQVSRKPQRCSICRKEILMSCDWQQGRCPHLPSMVEQILAIPYKVRFYNLIKFFKGKV